MKIIAKYDGRCRECGRRLPKGSLIEWSRSAGARHIACPKNEDTPYILRGGGKGWEAGSVVRAPRNLREQGYPEWLYVVEVDREFIREDGLSFGVGADSGYLYTAYCRAATPEEIAPIVAELRRERIRMAVREELRRIANVIRFHGEFPPGMNTPDGEVIPIGEGQSVYSGGEWIVASHQWIWAVRNNGMDGDDWSRNNVRTGGAGAIGYRMAASPEILRYLKELSNLQGRR